jgi:hypothetical protein
MIRTSVHVRPHRPAAYPALGVFLLGGILALSAAPGTAQNPGKAASKSEQAKEKEPEPLKLTLATNTPDVVEMVKLINEKLEAGWKANKITPSRYVDDHEFIRRATLDIIGRIAKPDEIRQYEKDPKDKRRSLLIERLLKSDEYAKHWGDMWSNWLLTRSGPFGRGLYHDQMKVWLEDQFATNKPYNQFVTELITAKGKNSENGAVNFILAHVGEDLPAPRRLEEGRFEMVPLTSRITRLFLGVQTQCAQCHPHPFYSSLKQEHFWGVNAFLRQVDREGQIATRRDDSTMTLTLTDRDSFNAEGLIYYEQRNGVVKLAKAEFLPSGDASRGQRLPLPREMKAKGKSRRDYLAEYILEHENFPKAIVNRMWGAFFGRGFTNPVDDFNDNNQPSNSELFIELAARFKHYDCDLKKLIRWICNSNAYHLSCVANKTNDKPELEPQFGRMVMKSMSPEQLFESLWVATTPDGLDVKTDKKTQREKWLNSLISNFGDDEGNEVNFNGTVVQALMMMNGEDLNAAITREKATVALAMARARAPADVIAELYLASLNRKPTPKEVITILAQMELRPLHKAMDVKNPAARYQDLFWALLNSNEFLLNH